MDAKQRSTQSKPSPWLRSPMAIRPDPLMRSPMAIRPHLAPPGDEAAGPDAANPADGRPALPELRSAVAPDIAPAEPPRERYDKTAA